MLHTRRCTAQETGTEDLAGVLKLVPAPDPIQALFTRQFDDSIEQLKQ